MKEYKELIAMVATSGAKAPLLELLKFVEDQISDVRKGDYSLEARLEAVEILNKLLTTPIESYGAKRPDTKPETYI